MIRRVTAIAIASYFGAIAAPALAEEAAPSIRPSKMLTVESAATIPAGARLLSLSGRALQFYYGLSDRLQFEFGTDGLSLLPIIIPQLRAQAKATLFEAGAFSLGLGAVAAMATLSASPTASVFVPMSIQLAPGLGLNVVPRVGYTAGMTLGGEVGVAYQVHPDWVFIAEDRIANAGAFNNNFLVGGAFTGFSANTTLTFGLISGAGTALSPLGLGSQATLHQGF